MWCSQREGVPDEQEQFTLHQYSKAIRHLQPHFSPRNKDYRISTRIALITYALFMFLEFLRGHYTTGSTCLLNGLKLLRETQARSEEPSTLKSSLESTDDWIIETFARIHVQALLLGQGSPTLPIRSRCFRFRY